MRKKMVGAAFLAAVLLGTGCAGASGETYLFDAIQKQTETRAELPDGGRVILLTHSMPESSAAHRVAEKFKTLLEERSGGHFRVDIFPDDTLGYVTDNDAALINGSIEMRIGAGGTLSVMTMLWAPTLSRLSLPEIADLLQEGEIRRIMERECEEKGTKLLAAFPPQYRVATSNVKVQSFEDFSRLTMRIFSSNATEGPYWQSLGAKTAVYDIHQVFAALQQGLVNSQENTLPIIVSSGIHRQQRYLLKTNHKIYFDCMLMGKEFYDLLDADEQALLNEVAAETADYAAEMDEAEQKRCERTLEAAGVESLELSEELREQMREAAGPVVEAALRSQYGDDKMDRILSVLTP
ncbi:TRAP transporter substrate-binding protein [Cuneatibacter sp. NSJ-177]|uniref:TRAP transporter substrate-binding protein n=1 Tax=Cuneatibacter sp. NSJ-177 TaxID=2931401 RepID=UPI001FD51DC6|nr:TRAP transporter substrate-binding protein [Cuneatibacter sp. NSJ-177]MCJ7834751.1 TRAP transporter substrate-binding protein [Cuneatibacter sp. NSJ-177]